MIKEIDKKDLFKIIKEWIEEAEKYEINDHNAVSLATLGDNQQPNLRMVLIKQIDTNGFVFYTNEHSQKGKDIKKHNNVALLWHWKTINKQIRVIGKTEKVTEKQSNQYFATRDRKSQIGAWASQQSSPLEQKDDLKDRVKFFTEKYQNKTIPRPPYWYGWRVIPQTIELWKQGENRLHERRFYEKQYETEKWKVTYLFP